MTARRLPILVLVLTVVAIAAVTVLEVRTDASRRAQLRVASVTETLNDLERAPFFADPHAGGDPARAQAEIKHDEAVVSASLADLGATPSSLATARQSLAGVDSVVAAVYQIAVSPAGLNNNPRTPQLQREQTARSEQLNRTLTQIARTDAARARRSRLATILGSAAAMLALMLFFLTSYFRASRARDAAQRLAYEVETLLELSRRDATTDALTGLRNRRALIEDLAAATSEHQDPELLLVIFDLNGFKQYNDTFGHAAGDALLARLGEALAAAATALGHAYRMGGDEFCLLARCTAEQAERLIVAADQALTHSGDGWQINSCYGAVWIPSQATTAADALVIADQRMYAGKASRASAGRQVTDALLQVVHEQQRDEARHVQGVSALAEKVAAALGLPVHEIQRISLAATLHDVGKTALPSAILDKPGPLSEPEWAFMREHTLVGERIVTAAPALANAAPLIRSSHERVDGDGYPDRLAGTQIPLGAKIIAVCDAFDAMTSTRPYRQSCSTAMAIAELRRCAGSQFDPHVVEVFCAILMDEAEPRAPSLQTVLG